MGESVINKDDSEYSLVDLLYIYILYITHCINNFSIYISFRQKNIILLIIISYKIKINIVNAMLILKYAYIILYLKTIKILYIHKYVLI